MTFVRKPLARIYISVKCYFLSKLIFCRIFVEKKFVKFTFSQKFVEFLVEKLKGAKTKVTHSKISYGQDGRTLCVNNHVFMTKANHIVIMEFGCSQHKQRGEEWALSG